MKGLDGLQPPGLSLLAFALAPYDRLPVGRKDQSGTGIRHLDPIAARFEDIQEESLLDGVLVRTGFNGDAVLQENIRRAQNILAAVDGVRHMVEAAARARMIAGKGKS